MPSDPVRSAVFKILIAPGRDCEINRVKNRYHLQNIFQRRTNNKNKERHSWTKQRRVQNEVIENWCLLTFPVAMTTLSPLNMASFKAFAFASEI